MAPAGRDPGHAASRAASGCHGAERGPSGARSAPGRGHAAAARRLHECGAPLHGAWSGAGPRDGGAPGARCAHASAGRTAARRKPHDRAGRRSAGCDARVRRSRRVPGAEPAGHSTRVRSAHRRACARVRGPDRCGYRAGLRNAASAAPGAP